MKKTIKMKYSDRLFVGFFCLFLFLMLTMLFKIYYVSQELQELQNDISILNHHTQPVTQTEYTQTIDFLENEFIYYREFVKDQQNFLIWLIGLIGASLTGLFAFFNIKGKEDIANIIKERYSNQIQKEIGDLIGGQERVLYLQKCIENEERAQNKKILFLLQGNENESLMKVYDILINQKYCVKKQKIVGSVKDKMILKWAGEYDIIVYQVPESEYAQNKESDDKIVTYAKLSKECNREGVFCVLYCEDNRGLKRELYSSYFYVSNANYGLTVLERIYNLLFFARENEHEFGK